MDRSDFTRFIIKLETAFNVNTNNGSQEPFYPTDSIVEWVKLPKVKAIVLSDEFFSFALDQIVNEGKDRPPRQLAGTLVRLHDEFHKRESGELQRGRTADFLPENESDYDFDPRCPDCEMGWIHYVVKRGDIQYPAVARCKRCYSQTTGVMPMTTDEVRSQTDLGEIRLLGRSESRGFAGKNGGGNG